MQDMSMCASPLRLQNTSGKRKQRRLGLPLSKFAFEAVEAFRASKDETSKSEMVRELAEAKEETQKLRSELKMKTLLLEKLEADVYKARYANFQEVEMAEGTRRHDQELESPQAVSLLAEDGRLCSSLECIKNEMGQDGKQKQCAQILEVRGVIGIDPLSCSRSFSS